MTVKSPVHMTVAMAKSRWKVANHEWILFTQSMIILCKVVT